MSRQHIAWYQVDAFVDDTPFSGNPAAVCPLQEWLAEDLMQSIAGANALSETAFCVATGNGEKDRWQLRWFTPEKEVTLCGHATLACAHVLLRESRAATTRVRFDTLSGELEVREADNIMLQNALTMDFPAWPVTDELDSEAVATALGAEPQQVWTAGENLLCLFRSQQAVAQLAPEMTLLARLPWLGLIATAPASQDGVDFVSRYFAPAAGVNEDPVTGSAHCTLAPFWAQRLNKQQLTARQISRRGGVVHCEVLRGDHADDRVILTGRTRLFASGGIHLGRGFMAV